MDENKIMVSVLCITYNHEKYIRKALEGFVIQKTNFNFEVIIHDDASTDGTVDIIKEYADKYSFIQPIYQEKNQYSKNIPFLSKYVYPKVKGKYIAFCEGDDYWTDEYKLQTLYDYMIRHEECSMCCHAYENIEANSEKQIEEIHTLSESGIISIDRAIKYDKPSQLASQMFKRECVINKPQIFLDRGVGDYTLLLYAAILGELYYIDKVMAKHRIASEGSWTNRVYKNKHLRIEHYNKMIEFLKDFDLYSESNYHDYVQDKIEEYKFNTYIAQGDYKLQLRHPKYKNLKLKRKIFIICGCLCPKIFNKINDKREFN